MPRPPADPPQKLPRGWTDADVAREQRAERNALWFMGLVLAGFGVFVVYMFAHITERPTDPTEQLCEGRGGHMAMMHYLECVDNNGQVMR